MGKQGEKPAFYVSEQSQQRKFTCVACEEFNDVLGRFGEMVKRPSLAGLTWGSPVLLMRVRLMPPPAKWGARDVLAMGQ